MKDALAYLQNIAGGIGLRPDDYWAMLRAYFDESGTHEDSEVFVLAGLVSTVDQWEKLTVHWQRILDKAGLEDFHMVDCAHGVKAFEGWSPEQRGELVKELVSVIKRCVGWRTWTALLRDEMAQCFKEESEYLRLEYSICAMGCASRIRSIAIHRDTFVPYFFEQGGRGGALACSVFRDLIETGQKELYRMGALSVDDRRRVLPLQAADLHAYEIYKYFAGVGRTLSVAHEGRL